MGVAIGGTLGVIGDPDPESDPAAMGSVVCTDRNAEEAVPRDDVTFCSKT